MTHRLITPLAMAAVLLPAAAALAQTDSDLVQRLERQLREFDIAMRLSVPADQPISERLLVDYGAAFRFGFYAFDDDESNTRILRQSDARLFLRAELDGAHRFFGQLRFLYDDFNSGDSPDGRGDELHAPIGDRYWYEFDYRGLQLAQKGEAGDFNLNLKVGKQFVHWGSGLTLSKALYAALLDIEFDRFGLTLLGSLTPSTGTIDFDGSRPGFDSDTDRVFFGGALEYRGWTNHRPYGFVLIQRDHNERDFFEFDTLLGPVPTDFQYDSEYFGLGVKGQLRHNLRYTAEMVMETGEGLSNSFNPVGGLAVPQTEEDISAFAGVANLTWLLMDERNSRVDFEIVAGSGDDDRVDSSDTFGGNLSGTDDHAFNSFGYVNTGLALAPDPSNLFVFRTGYSTTLWQRPNSQPGMVRGGVNGLLFTKIESDAPISVATNNESFVGSELNLFIDWQITSDVTASMRYGIFLPGDAIPEAQDDARHFFYTGVTYAF